MSAPRKEDASAAKWAFELACLLAAVALLGVHVARLANGGAPGLLGAALALVAGALAADFVSGLVHWSADTWGREDFPVLGRRFLTPFRVHHANPDDILRRGFVDLNGDVALLGAPVLAAALWLPLDVEAGRVAEAFVTAFVAISLPTNQVHQWAHMRERPRIVTWLQRAGLILRPAQHQVHHTAPYLSRYCIATGWCNAPLEAVGFFRAAERAIQRVTGAVPRQEDADYAARVATDATASEDAPRSASGRER